MLDRKVTATSQIVHGSRCAGCNGLWHDLCSGKDGLGAWKCKRCQSNGKKKAPAPAPAPAARTRAPAPIAATGSRGTGSQPVQSTTSGAAKKRKRKEVAQAAHVPASLRALVLKALSALVRPGQGQKTLSRSALLTKVKAIDAAKRPWKDKQEWKHVLKALEAGKCLTYIERDDTVCFPGEKGYDSSDDDL